MMNKVEINVTLYEDQQAWLEAMAVKYDLPDASKALRVLVDFAVEDGDLDTIFETVRCRHC